MSLAKKFGSTETLHIFPSRPVNMLNLHPEYTIEHVEVTIFLILTLHSALSTGLNHTPYAVKIEKIGHE